MVDLVDLSIVFLFTFASEHPESGEPHHHGATGCLPKFCGRWMKDREKTKNGRLFQSKKTVKTVKTFMFRIRMESENVQEISHLHVFNPTGHKLWLQSHERVCKMFPVRISCLIFQILNSFKTIINHHLQLEHLPYLPHLSHGFFAQILL